MPGALYPHIVEAIQVTFATAADSPVIDLRMWTVCGLITPSGWLGSTVKFKVFDSNAAAGSFVTMKDGAGSDYSKTVGASQYIGLTPSDFAGIPYIILTSSSASEASTVKLMVRAIQ
jgi:hypothetical protein